MPVPISRSWRPAAALGAAILFLIPTAAAGLSVDWVTVGGAGNACDTQSQGCFGAVAADYRVAKTEVTNAEYAEFLNAVAATDTNGLYNTSMGSGFGGIARSGVSGSYSYSAIGGSELHGVNYVSFWDALRFANWLHNGQPTGAQGNSTTEDGAYTITPAGIAANSIVRNGGATVFLTSEDEWYKAAYYDAGGASYFAYPASSDTQTTCATAGATANTANCNFAVFGLTDAASYTASASPAGTFDQGGNVWEWNEAVLVTTNRGIRGGSFSFGPTLLAASFQSASVPSNEVNNVGFRVASLVPPPVPFLPPVGLALLGGALGLLGWRRLAIH